MPSVLSALIVELPWQGYHDDNYTRDIVPEPAYLKNGIVHGDQSTSEIVGELGGALYIMFENHVRSWLLLKTP